MARRTKGPDRYQWDRNARRVQTLRTGVRVFDHEGRSHTVHHLADLAPLVDSITEADPECGERIVAELDVYLPGAVAAALFVWNREPRT